MIFRSIFLVLKCNLMHKLLLALFSGYLPSHIATTWGIRIHYDRLTYLCCCAARSTSPYFYCKYSIFIMHYYLGRHLLF
ncbi:hypothetical protein BGZ63DRAFT_208595 [Mariannaea sp. PMI_226]|nr:hypothetical protein BGZ63DRAFT_208595 [Mariannaea sp. PMI_226]